jgi:hypothetical protein
MPLPPPALRLDWDQVAAWRQRRHHLDERVQRADLLAVVSGIAGLHAQVMSSAELTLWARVGDLKPSAVRDALWRDRTLVKTWAMRGTLHLLPAAELPLWQAGQSTRRADERAAWQRRFGVTLEQLEAMLAAVATALADGRMVGTWRQQARGGRLLVTVEPFRKLSARARRGVADEAERLAAWTGAELQLAWAPDG